MSGAPRRLTALAPAGLIALLAATGCGTPLPSGPTKQEILAFQQEESRSWWEGMYPDAPMPVVEVVAFTEPGTREALLDACVAARIGPPENSDYPWVG